MSARLQDRWNRMKSDGVIIQISFWEWNGVQIFVLIFLMSFTITPHRPAFAGWTAFAGRARGIRWLNGICSTGLRYKDHIGNPMVSAYVQFLYIFSAGLSNWMGWTSEKWLSRFSISSRLSKCSFYVGVELGGVPEKQCERLAPSAFNTHVRKLAKNICTDPVRRLVCETVHHLVCAFLRYQNIFTVYEPVEKLHKCKLAKTFGNLFMFRGARRMCVCVSLCPCVTESMSWSAWKERC